MASFRPVLTLATGMILVASNANASSSIGAFAVGDHTPCGVGDIPGTIKEIDKLFAHPDAGFFGQKSYYFKETEVKQFDWHKSTDYVADESIQTGYRGADGVQVSYIASHGGTSSGVYKASMGSKNHGGCFIKSSDMQLGNNLSRYTVLSTCQGLKIGNGDNPNANGENPSVTWKSTAPGTNCIFGYSNNMADADGYGVYFLDRIKLPFATVKKAFFDASDAVDDGNVPAALCFGETKENAQSFMDGLTTFDSTTQQSNAASVYSFKKSDFHAARHLKDSSEDFSAQIFVAPVKLNAKSLFSRAIGSSLVNQATQRKNLQRTEFSHEKGAVVVDAQSGFFEVVIPNDSVNTKKKIPDADEVTQIALGFIPTILPRFDLDQWFVDGHSYEGRGDIDGVQSVISRSIRFRQRLAGFQSVSQAGTIEVSVGNGGRVIGFRGLMLSPQKLSKARVSASEVSASVASLETTARESFIARYPNSELEVLDSRFGYELGNYVEAKKDGRAIALVTIEVKTGEFARRHRVKVALDDMSVLK